ncbi:hypothetical protein K466DRAFT_307317 [Polyporus arcularius HHB13444]|uniref:Uncharacterized protein n=1 Tax=Polyporus arcularius HHB13444 TaxID=1314778 RepID=A0A5C3P8V9_9APHY|nr:hypothetical protein K466DRAFT_307317 [Polyporus arcularius HHB13444]
MLVHRCVVYNGQPADATCCTPRTRQRGQKERQILQLVREPGRHFHSAGCLVRPADTWNKAFCKLRMRAWCDAIISARDLEDSGGTPPGHSHDARDAVHAIDPLHKDNITFHGSRAVCLGCKGCGSGTLRDALPPLTPGLYTVSEWPWHSIFCNGWILGDEESGL